MKVSILMITYNHEKYIAQAIDSILAQEVDFDYEIVIGEDCSTDRTRQIVTDYQKLYPDKIQLLLPESNLGMLPNFVNTYNSCRGEYIAVLEGDDYWISKDKLKKQVNFLDSNPDFTICFTNAVLFWEDQHREPILFSNGQALTYTIEDLLVRNFISTPTVMYRNGLIKDFPEWYLKQGMGDWTLYIMLAEYGKIGCINEVMSAYRIHEGGVWSSKDREYQLSKTIQMLQSIKEYFESKGNQKYPIILNNSINYYSQQLSSISSSTKENQVGLTSKEKPYKLHIGCGQNIFTDWINIDIEENHPQIDLLCDVRNGLPFENESCSFIYNEHVLEHLTAEEGVYFLQECKRVLQPGGILRVAMPNLEYIVEHYKSENWRNQDWLKWPEYQFIQTRAEMINICFRWWEHKWLYDFEELNRRLLEAGFYNIKTAEWGESTIPEFQHRETRGDSLLIIEAEVASLKLDLKSIPLVSICIPTYNGEAFISEAIHSVLSQTYSNIEVILSDDNSSDRTVEIAKSFQSQSPHNFSVLEHDQYGLAANWNFCISQAQGKYIKFLFQDDLLQPNAIAEMVSLAEQDQEIGLVFSLRKLITSTNYPHEALFLANHEAKDVHKGWSNLQSIQSGQELLQDLNILEHPINKIGEPSTILIRKEVFDVLGAFNLELCQLVDLEMWLRIMSQYKVGFVDRTLSSFRIHDQQQTKINSASQETLLLDYQRFFHTIITNTLYPQATRQAALYKYEILTGNNLQLSRRQLAEQCLSLEDYQLVDWYQGLSGKLQQTLMQEHSENSNLSPEDQQFANGLYTLIEQGFEQPENTRIFLAAMLYYRANEIPLPCDLSKIPDWLLADYLNYLFPKSVAFYQIGESESYYIYMCKWIDYLHDAISSHPDHPYWHQVVDIFSQIVNFIPTNINDHNLRDLYVKRAEIIEFFLRINGHELEYEFQNLLLSKKKIKLGIIVYQNTPSAETFATLPFYEYLSRDFEVFLYTIRKSEGSLAEYCRSCVNHAKLLPSDFEDQINSIRKDDLDILLFGANVTAITNQMCLLASHRLARIQVMSGGSIATTGLKNMDYFISGTLTDPDQNAQSQYQEELLQIPGTAHCFSYGNDEVVAQIKVDRSNLNIAPESVVFTSGANLFKIVPELFHTWAKIIAQVPNAILMLLPYGPNWSKSYLKQPFEDNLIHIFAEYGLSADQLIILDPQPVPNRADVKAYYQIADIYLDSYPFAGTTSLIEPLQVGLPVITRQGNSFRSAMGAAMLQSLDIAGLVADCEESYIQLAVNLSINPKLCQQKSTEIRAKMQDNPMFLDSRAYSAKIGDLFTDLVDKYYKNAQNESLQLRDINLMVFPDWNQSEEAVGIELQQIIQTLATQPNSQNTTLLIDTTNIALEDAYMFLSSISMNLMMEEDLDISDELGISLIEDLNNIQWENLLPRINSRIVMDCDHQETVANLLPENLAQRQIKSFILS
jgi:predicted O-linked N-acetylglucosamine transferase (SPINDLY family)/predicted SAM-dependent methyltransferase/GT2 family glycosyltransferase